MSKVVFIIELRGQPYTLLRDPVVWQEGRGGWPLYSQALVCPYCLDLWALMTTAGQHNGTSILGAPCDICAKPYGFSVPGSLLENAMCGWDETLLQSLSPELLSRELSLHLTHYQAHPNEL